MKILGQSLLAKVPPKRLVNLGLLAWSTTMVGIAIYRGSLHDYNAYQSHWKNIHEGNDPWAIGFDSRGEAFGRGSVYGPVHNFLVYFWEFNPLAPKIFMVAAFLLANVLIVRKLIQRNSTYRSYFVYSLVIPLNYLIIGNVASFGLNDSLVSALIVFAMLARLNKRIYLAAFFLTLAILLKYYPAFIFLFFLIDKKKIDIKLFLATTFMCSVGILATILIWGKSFLNSFTFGGGRPPKPLSILWSMGPVRNEADKNAILRFLIDYNSVTLILASLAIMYMIYKFNLSWTEGSVIGTLAISLLYKGSSIQYFLPLMVLLTLLIFVKSKEGSLLLKWMMPFVLFISIYAFGYEATGGYWTVMTQVRPNIGYLSFMLGLITYFGFFISVHKRASLNFHKIE
jgi:hypothetical protein